MNEKSISQKKLARMAGTYFLALSLSWLPAGLMQMHFDDIFDKTTAYTLGSLTQFLLAAMALFFCMLYARKIDYAPFCMTADKMFGFRPANPAHVWYGFLITLASYPLMGFIAGLAYAAVPDSMPALADADLQVLRSMRPVSAYVLLAVAPAVSEEIACRGVIYGASRNRGLFAAVSVSASCFALLHMNPAQAAYAFAFGMLLALMREFTGSVLPGIAAHAAFNAASVAAVYRDIPDTQAAENAAIYDGGAAYAALAIASAAFTAFAVWKMGRAAGYELDTSVDKNMRPVSAPHAIGWICCITVMLLTLS